uniref:SERRATE/Ars2 N-terminal domain-containing protein n=1 Tax=Ananas comosus var. bracteatus TaxID=296719 RepID=A0A6V7P497_ANACO|nr:unnamed protein product [Ananas comosus var. bracteatus]
MMGGTTGAGVVREEVMMTEGMDMIMVAEVATARKEVMAGTWVGHQIGLRADMAILAMAQGSLKDTLNNFGLFETLLICLLCQLWEGLMSYKQFIQELEDDVSPAESLRRYEEYKTEYITTQKRAYFDLHKEEDWLKDKYHPTNLVAVIEKRNEQARSTAKEFFLDLQSGTLDLGPGLTATSASKSGNASDANSEDETDLSSKRRRHGRGATKDNDLLSSAPKAHPVSSDPRRIQIDIEQAQALVRKLDSEKGIEDNILSSTIATNLMATNHIVDRWAPLL